MNVVMPRSNFDLRDLDAPPRWDALSEMDADLPDQIARSGKLQVAPGSTWGRGLTFITALAIVGTLVFAIAWEVFR
jgi:hypothetical protein